MSAPITGTMRIKSVQATLSFPFAGSLVRQSTRTQSQKIMASTAIPCPPLRRRGNIFQNGLSVIFLLLHLELLYSRIQNMLFWLQHLMHPKVTVTGVCRRQIMQLSQICHSSSVYL